MPDTRSYREKTIDVVSQIWSSHAPQDGERVAQIRELWPELAIALDELYWSKS